MDFATALTLASEAVTLFIKIEPVAVQGVKDFTPFVTSLIEKWTGQPITTDQRTAVEAKIDELHSQFQAPIPDDTNTLDENHPNTFT